MPNTQSIISTVVSEFSLYLADCRQDSYDFNIEVATQGNDEPTAVRMRLEGDGLSVWVNGKAYDMAAIGELQDAIYRAVRDLTVVKETIKQINLRADRSRYDADI